MTTKTIGTGLGSNATGSGTVTATNLSTSIVGLTTLFTSEYVVGGPVGVDNVSYEVGSITNDTHMTITINYAGTTGTTKTIQLGAHNFASVGPWVSYLQGIGTLGGQEFGDMYNDSEFTISAVTDFTGFTASAGKEAILHPATGQGFPAAANPTGLPLVYDQSKGVGIRATAFLAGNIKLSVDYVQIDGLQLETHNSGNAYSNSQLIYNTSTSTTHCTVNGCILQNRAPTGAGYSVYWRAGVMSSCNIIVDVDSVSGMSFSYPSGSPTLVNVNMVRPSNRTVGGSAFNADSGTATLVNCAAFGFTNIVNNAARFAGNNNASDVAIGFGSSNQASLTYTSQFEGTTSSAMDWRPKSGGALPSNGVKDATNAPLDIIGQTRASACTIGCWELVVSSAAILPPDLFMQVAA